MHFVNIFNIDFHPLSVVLVVKVGSHRIEYRLKCNIPSKEIPDSVKIECCFAKFKGHVSFIVI